MATVYLGLGSNIDPEANLRLAVSELDRRFDLVTVSPVYRSRAVGFDGPEFLNAAAVVRTEMTPQAICSEIDRIHERAGRERGPNAFASRTLDIDILLYGDRIIDEPPVRVPSPDILDYGFVLAPLADIDPALRHPATGKTLAQHWADFDQALHPLSLVTLHLPGQVRDRQ